MRHIQYYVYITYKTTPAILRAQDTLSLDSTPVRVTDIMSTSREKERKKQEVHGYYATATMSLRLPLLYRYCIYALSTLMYTSVVGGDEYIVFCMIIQDS